MLKHFFKKKKLKKQDNQTAFAGGEKKNHSRVGATPCCILSNYFKARQTNITHPTKRKRSTHGQLYI